MTTRMTGGFLFPAAGGDSRGSVRSDNGDHPHGRGQRTIQGNSDHLRDRRSSIVPLLSGDAGRDRAAHGGPPTGCRRTGPRPWQGKRDGP